MVQGLAWLCEPWLRIAQPVCDVLQKLDGGKVCIADHFPQSADYIYGLLVT